MHIILHYDLQKFVAQIHLYISEFRLSVLELFNPLLTFQNSNDKKNGCFDLLSLLPQVLKIQFSQDFISQGTVMTMGAHMGIYVRVMNPRTGQLVLAAVALATQPLAVRELAQRLALVRPGLLVMVTTLVSRRLNMAKLQYLWRNSKTWM